jgi:hypothetical protein
MKKTLIVYALVLGLTASFLVGFLRVSAVSANSPQQFDDDITSFINEARRASDAGEHRTITLTFSEDEIARMLTEMAEENSKDIPVSLKDIKVQFIDGNGYIHITAKVKYFFFDTKVSANVLLTPRGKHGYYEVTDISFGDLPGALVDWIVKRIPYPMSGSLPLGNLPVELQDIYFKDGRLYISAVTVPEKAL